MLPTLNNQNTPAQMSTMVWKINPKTGTYDIFNAFTSNDNSGNLEVIKSKILILLSIIQGEFKPAPLEGIPLIPLLENSDNPDVQAQIIINEILTIQNVNRVSVNSFDYNAATRVLNASFNVNTAFGSFVITIG